MKGGSPEAECHNSTGAERTWYRKWGTVNPLSPPPTPALLLHDTTKGRLKINQN